MSQQWGQYGYGYDYQPVGHRPACVFCKVAGEFGTGSRVSTGGWVMFAILLLLCVTVPICWIPLVAMKEHARFCKACGQMQGGWG